MTATAIDVRVGNDLSIVGVPLDFCRLGLPVWKRASLAIDPRALMDQDGDWYMLVDTATRQKLSCSLVVARW